METRLLELDLLRTLIAVIEYNSFTEAAHGLNKTQAAVSLQIRRLEELAGVILIDRSRRGVRLTDEGERLLDYARRMIALNDEALAAIRPDHVAGAVRLGAVTYYAVTVLPPLLSEFSARHPAVRIEVLAGTSFREVPFGPALDLAIALEPAGVTNGLCLARERAVWATSRHHDTDQRAPLPVAVLPEGALLRKWALADLERQQRPWRIAYVTANASALVSTIEAGLAVGVIRAGSLTPALRELTPDDGFPLLPLFDITLTDGGAGLGRAARTLRDFLAARLPQAVAAPMAPGAGGA